MNSLGSVSVNLYIDIKQLKNKEMKTKDGATEATKKLLLHFFYNVMIKLNYYDWLINFCNDNYCRIRYKVINIDVTYNGDVRQIILHEIAHIDTAKYCNQTHNPVFWKRLEYLTQKFLGRNLDKQQKEHKKFMTTGYYSLCYKNE